MPGGQRAARCPNGSTDQRPGPGIATGDCSHGCAGAGTDQTARYGAIASTVAAGAYQNDQCGRGEEFQITILHYRSL